MRLLNLTLAAFALIAILQACTALVQTNTALQAHKSLFNRQPAVLKQ